MAGAGAFHCQKSNKATKPMANGPPNNLGVDQDGLSDRIESLLPGYVAMGESGMSEHMEHLSMGAGKNEPKTRAMAGMHHGMHGEGGLKGPVNTLPMMLGKGPFGSIEMGGMFTVLKVRDELEGDRDPGWYANPPGTVASRVKG